MVDEITTSWRDDDVWLRFRIPRHTVWRLLTPIPPYWVVYIYLSTISITMTPSTVTVGPSFHNVREPRVPSKLETNSYVLSNIVGLLFIVPTCGGSLLTSLLGSMVVDGVHNYRYNSTTGYWFYIYTVLPLLRGGFIRFTHYDVRFTHFYLSVCDTCHSHYRSTDYSPPYQVV